MFLKPLAQSFSLRTFSRRFLAASSSPKKTQGSLPKAKQRSKTLVNISEEQKLAELKRRRIEKNENLRELLDALERLDTSAVWEIHSKPLRIDEPTYTKMVALMAKAGYVKKTFSLYQKLKKRALKPSLDTFYWLLISLVNAASDGDYVSRVFYVVEQLEKYGYLLTLRLSNLMLLVCARAKDRASCSSVLSIMLKHRVRPDVSSLTTLIHCSKGEGLDNINLMWKSVLKFFDPDIRAWNTYLTLLREENYTEEVFLIFEHLLAYSAVRVKTSRLAKWEEKNRVLAAGSKREGVIEVLDGRNSIKGDKSPREALKLATASSEDNAEVVGFSGDDDGYMNKNGTRNEESVCIEYVAQDSEGIDCQNNHNKNRIGASVASQFGCIDSSRSTVYVDSPSFSNHELVFDPDLLPLESIPVPDQHTISMILNLCSEKKEYVYAKFILELLLNSGHKLDIAFDRPLIHSMFRIASRASLDHVVAVEKLMGEKKLSPNIETYGIMMMAYGRLGDTKKTMDIFSQAEKSFKLSTFFFTSLLIACRKSGDVDMAWKSIEQMTKLNLPVDRVYLNILREILEKNHRQDLLEKLSTHPLVLHYRKRPKSKLGSHGVSREDPKSDTEPKPKTHDVDHTDLKADSKLEFKTSPSSCFDNVEFTVVDSPCAPAKSLNKREKKPPVSPTPSSRSNPPAAKAPTKAIRRKRFKDENLSNLGNSKATRGSMNDPKNLSDGRTKVILPNYTP